MKEVIIIITIITGILFGNFSALKYIKTNSEELSNKLMSLKENVRADDPVRQINEIYDIWQTRKNKLAVIIEHSHMDKIEIGLIEIRTALEENETTDIMQKIDKIVFLLEDLKEKDETNLKNIF